MRFDILTIFPDIFDSYFSESIIKRAREKKLVEIRVHNIRKFGIGRHKQVDDHPYGGGAGMVMMALPIVKSVETLLKKAKKPYKLILLSAKGKQFDQEIAYKWSKKFKNIILISGRYEGIDERVRKILKAEEISVGPYVTTDGDVAAMVIVSAIARLIPGVIKWESVQDESFFNQLIKAEKNTADEKTLEYPHYTRPEVLRYKGKAYRAPKVLLSGAHREIKEWRKAHLQSRKLYKQHVYKGA